MYLRIGSRLRPFLEARADAIAYVPEYDVGRRMVAVRESWRVSGRLVLEHNATGQRAMTTALRQLETDLSQFRPDVVILEDDGVTPTFFELLAGDCVSGPDITEIILPAEGTDIYSIATPYAFTVEATRSLNNLTNSIVEFREEVDFDPGGLVYGHVGGAINFAERQIFKENEIWRATQSGVVVGKYGPVSIPGPLWPAALVKAPRMTEPSPRILAPVLQEYETRYVYTFESATPIPRLSPHILT